MARNILGTYTCASNEQWDWLALDFYGDEKYTSDLMNANPEYCGITVFSGGEEIYVPNLGKTGYNIEEAMANTQAPWKQ